MKLLVLVQVFPPDNVATAQLYGELCLELAAHGWDVRVVSTWPHYARDPLATAWNRGWTRRFPWSQADHNGIKVIRIAMPDRRPGFLRRVAAWSWWHAASLAVPLRQWRPDVILCPSPPPSVALVSGHLARRYGCPFVYNVQELYPDVAINLGLVKSALLISLLRSLERWIYHNAAAITVISPRMLRAVKERTAHPDRAVLIPNFADTDRIRPFDGQNTFVKEFGLENAFVVSYAGNMGKPQQLDTLVRAAASLRGDADLRFLFVGSGTEKANLMRLARQLSAANVSFIPYQPYSRMSEIYAASHICYVPQAAGTTTDGVPSKVYRIMAAARPILAATDADSDLAVLVRQANAGFVVPPTDPEAVACAIRRARGEGASWLERGRAGRAHVEQYYSRKVIGMRYNELLAELARDSREQKRRSSRA